MYGTRDAASNWEEAYSTFLASKGFTKGVASPCVFFSASRGIRLMVHGNDFVLVGTRFNLETTLKDFYDQYECKHELIVPYSDLSPLNNLPGRVRLISGHLNPTHYKKIMPCRYQYLDL